MIDQRNSSWGRGYYTDVTYGSYCFKELAPNWLDFAALSKCCLPPNQASGEGFSYLELGSGMGLGLCLLAAAYPESTFVGVDFHPSHIAHSQWLTAELRLPNVQFYEADFLQMASSSFKSPFHIENHFHYVVAHGILSWISPEVRDALFSIVSYSLRPGGIFYCSYNTYPGWLERSAFKALLDLEINRLGGSQIPHALAKTSQSLQRLLKESEVGQTPLGKAFPRLAVQLQSIDSTTSLEYLCGEFGHENWQPFYVGDVHRQALAYKLGYVASASLPENHPDLLPPSPAAIVCSESDSQIQQALLDFAINQSFRRDLFVKGKIQISRCAQNNLLSSLRLRLTDATRSQLPMASDQDNCISIATSLGHISDPEGRFQQIVEMLAVQPSTLAEIYQNLGIPPKSLLPITSLLLHSGRVSLDRGAAIQRARKTCSDVNQRIIELMQGGHNLGFLAAPNVGHGSQPFSLIDAFIYAGIRHGLEGDMLASCVWMGMDAAGIELSDTKDGLLSDPEQRLSRITHYIAGFRADTLPCLIQLGIAGDLGQQ